MRRRWLSVGLATGVFLAPMVAQTFTFPDPENPRHWPALPVQICVSTKGHKSIDDEDGGVVATIQAINSTHPRMPGTGWNVTPIGQVVEAVPCDIPWDRTDGRPTIAFDDMLKTCDGSCLAQTWMLGYTCDRRFPDGHCTILDADVQTRRNKVNRRGGPFYSFYEPCNRREYSIEAVMVHEVGHVLGLWHTDVPGATMLARELGGAALASCKRKAEMATIEDDDIAGLSVLYPP